MNVLDYIFQEQKEAVSSKSTGNNPRVLLEHGHLYIAYCFKIQGVIAEAGQEDRIYCIKLVRKKML